MGSLKVFKTPVKAVRSGYICAMLRFQHFDYLWLLTVLPLLALLFLWARASQRRRLDRLGEMRLLLPLMPGYHPGRLVLKFLLLSGALFTGIVGLANLQSSARSEKIERKGNDVMIALDVSRSMLARDLSPNRLEKARQLVLRLLEKMGNDRVGLILFAGRAYVSVPLTVDFSALKMNLSTASPDLVPTQGTVLSEAIRMARGSFNPKETKYKSIILISDGEDHDEEARAEARKAAEEGVMICTVGVGTPEGSPIFDEESGQNKTDAEGKEINTKLNEKELESLAEAGQGIYRRLGSADAVAGAISSRISSAGQRSFGDTVFTDYSSYFQYFLGISLLLMVLESLIPESKTRLKTA